MAENGSGITIMPFTETAPRSGSTALVDHGSLFSITTNPNSNNNYNNAFNFMSSSHLPSFHPFAPLFPNVGVKEEKGKEEMNNMESMSGGSELHIEGGNNDFDTLSGGINHLLPPSSKKKRYHRHTIHQIQQMEAMFRECPHPDDKQRMRLSQDLGLRPRQVKFWFQNRRTQMKAQQDRTENQILRSENDNLKDENYRMQAVLRSLFCPSCGGGSILGEVEYDEHQLHLENARLKQELDKVCDMASRFHGRPVQSFALPPPALLPPSLELDMNIYSSHNFQDPIPMPMLSEDSSLQFPSNDELGLILDEEKPIAMELAVSSMNELVKMSNANGSLWARKNDMDLLNVDEYSRLFSSHPLKRHYDNVSRVEGTRDTAVVIMNSINLVESFLDANKWMGLFPSIVARAKTIQILDSGVSSHLSGSLHLMYAELQVVTPLVPTREIYFLRYCKQNIEEGTWGIVDFPIDNFHGSLQLSQSIPRYKRYPSGMLIQDMPNGYSRVTWIEHGEIIEEKPTHQIFDPYLHSMVAFGAKRWLGVLQRQCERVASLMARNIADLGVIQSLEARKNVMKLSERMMRTFCVNMSTSGGQSWTSLSESIEDTVRVTTRRITEAGQPNGLILNAVSTTRLNFSHDQVFEFLKNQGRRSQIEALSNGSLLHEVAHIANGSHPGNCISLFRVTVGGNSSQNVELMLQESSMDLGGGLIVFATMEVDYIQLVMSGNDPSTIPILPIGFSILPLVEGCLLTMGVHILASANPNAKLNLSTVSAVNNHISTVLDQINAALNSNNTNNAGVSDMGSLSK